MPDKIVIYIVSGILKKYYVLLNLLLPPPKQLPLPPPRGLPPRPTPNISFVLSFDFVSTVFLEERKPEQYPRLPPVFGPLPFGPVLSYAGIIVPPYFCQLIPELYLFTVDFRTEILLNLFFHLGIRLNR
jgi:hypothetical protein